jgi:DNA-binding transcriptional LysR family regulator
VLEGYLQMPLTERQGRRLVLSQHGREYYRSIRAAFNVLRQATEHLAEQAQTRQVTISLIPLFGMGWFIPRCLRLCAPTRRPRSTWCMPTIVTI